ncbi:MAG: cadherin-like beta sandwich domain-containing protein [Candidatus Hydrogenedentes bacterium]|nr:cadherin-like beta sandwich domain-containing protein [Candidatus Hydrogenedentota bacterium]
MSSISAVTGPDVTLRELSVTSATLSPQFSSGRTAYTSYVPHGVESVAVTAVPGDAAASLSVNGAPVSSGSPSEKIALSPGRNLVEVLVTSSDGSAKNRYTIKIIRALATPTWIKVQESGPWSPRDSAGELVFKDRMWLIGGYTPPLVNDVWSTSDGKEWTPAGVIPDPIGVNIPVNLVHNDQMWVTSNDGKLYSSPDGATWTLVTDQAPWRGRYGAGGVVFNGKMWAMGGLKKEGELFNDVWSSKDGVQWTLETEHAAWSPRQIFGMLAVHDSKIWLLGGGISIYHPFKAYNDVWTSADGKKWTLVTDAAPWPARIWSTSAVYRNRLWLIGGFRAEPTWNNFDDVWYSMDGKDWRQLQCETVWSPRHEISAYVFGDKLWVVGGNAWPLMNDVWSLQITALTFLSQPVIEEFANAQYSYRAQADFNASRTKIRYRLIESPDWLKIDAETGFVRGTSTTPGDYPVTIEAYDNTGETARQSYTLHVVPVG